MSKVLIHVQDNKSDLGAAVIQNKIINDLRPKYDVFRNVKYEVLDTCSIRNLISIYDEYKRSYDDISIIIESDIVDSRLNILLNDLPNCRVAIRWHDPIYMIGVDYGKTYNNIMFTNRELKYTYILSDLIVNHDNFDLITCNVLDKEFILNVIRTRYNTTTDYSSRVIASPYINPFPKLSRSNLPLDVLNISPACNIDKSKVKNFTKPNKIMYLAGYSDYIKGFTILMYTILKSKVNEYEWYIIGNCIPSEDNSPDIYELFSPDIKKLKSRTDVHIIGRVPNTEMSKYYELCDTVLIASLTESFCITAIEGFTYGNHVIALDTYDVPWMYSNQFLHLVHIDLPTTIEYVSSKILDALRSNVVNSHQINKLDIDHFMSIFYKSLININNNLPKIDDKW